MGRINKDGFDQVVAKMGDKNAAIQKIHSMGHTIEGIDTNPASGSTLPQEPSLGSKVWSGAKQVLGAEIPGLAQAGKYLGETLPNQMAEAGHPVAGFGVSVLGDAIPRTVGEAALVAASGPIAKGLAPIAKAVAPNIVSFLTRESVPVTTRLVERVSQLGDKALLDPALTESLVTKLGTQLESARSILGQKLGQIAEIAKNRHPEMNIDLSGIANDAAGKLAKAGIAVDGYVVEKGRKMSVDTSRLLGQMEGPTNFEGVLNLKRDIANALDQGRKGVVNLSGAEEAILKGAQESLNTVLAGKDKTFKAASDAFAGVAQGIDDLLGKGQVEGILNGKVETVQRKITSLFKNGSAERKLIEKIDSISKGASATLDRILDSETAKRFNPLLNPGVQRAAENTGGGLAPYATGAAGATAAIGAMTGNAPATAGGLGYLALRGAYNAVRSPYLNRLAVQGVQAAARNPEASTLAGLMAARKARRAVGGNE